MRSPRLLLGSILLALAIAGCHREDPGSVRLLLDGEHAADALVEDREIARPPALGGNRFLSGWWPSKKGKELLLRPEPPRARIQVVNLGSTARTLYLDLKQAPAGSSKVRVKAAGRDLGAFPV